MVNRIPFELVNSAPDSSSRIEEIDTRRYADESVPRGYARQASVVEDCCPTCAPDPSDPKFHNER